MEVKNMPEVVKETITTQSSRVNPEANTASGVQTVQYLIYFLFGVLEILLAFRLILKFAGANIASSFVRFIYGATAIFILPFEGIFRRGYAQGIETSSVLEPATLIAIIAYAILAWGLVKLLRILTGQHNQTE